MGSILTGFGFRISSKMRLINVICPHCKNFLDLRNSQVPFITNGLPFTSEGYTRAKIIFMTKYGKSNEVANAPILNRMSLPHINSVNHQKFFEKNTQCAGFTCYGKNQRDVVIYSNFQDGLQLNKPDLVRNDDNQQE